MSVFKQQMIYNGCAMMVILFAFAKANSQSNDFVSTSKTYTITKDFDRVKLLQTLDEIRKEKGLEVRLTDYSNQNRLLKKFGLAIRAENREWVDFVTANQNGIEPICIRVQAQFPVVMGSCENLPKEEIAITNIVGTDASKGSPSKVSMIDAREQQLDSLKAIAYQNQLERRVIKQEAGIQQAEERQSYLQDKQIELIAATDSLQILQNLEKARLKDLEVMVNEYRREYTQLTASNKRQRAIRDSLQNQQIRLQAQIEQQREELSQAISLTKENEKIIRQQQDVIEQQGLKAETAESLKAYRTAMLGKSDDQNFKSRGYLGFAMQQCLYETYNGYTIVYGNQGNFLFTINKELGSAPISGSLKVKGEDFTYTYTGNVLFIKNQEGELVDENGNVLAVLNGN